MLIVSDNYKSLKKMFEKENIEEEIAAEDLTNKGIKELTTSLKKNADLLDDSDVDKYSDRIVSFASRKTFDKYDYFFKAHGILEFKKEIVKTFVDNKCSDILENIIANDGLLDKSDLEGSGKNLFSQCAGFENPAKYIATLAGQHGNKAEGEFEVLLRLILKNGGKPPIGDVSIGNFIIEVKKSNSHPYDQKTLRDSIIFYTVDKAFTKSIVNEPGIVNYTEIKNPESNKLFNTRLSEFAKKGKNRETIKNAVVDGVAKQYALATPSALMQSIASEYTFTKHVNSKTLVEFIGRLQLAAYAEKARFDGFIILNNNGDYLYSDTSDLAETSKQLTFGGVSLAASSRPGATMFLK